LENDEEIKSEVNFLEHEFKENICWCHLLLLFEKFVTKVEVIIVSYNITAEFGIRIFFFFKKKLSIPISLIVRQSTRELKQENTGELGIKSWTQQWKRITTCQAQPMLHYTLQLLAQQPALWESQQKF
jgi:ABC-type uncharacterized transport system permease subunit